MNILYLPYNVASMQGITADAMNKLSGVKAINISVGDNPFVTPGQHTLEIKSPKKNFSIGYIYYQLKKCYYFLRLIFWADIVHYCWNSFLPFDLDLKIIRWLKKPGVVEWVGSDIRNPEIAFKFNPYLKKVFNSGYEYKKLESDNVKLDNLRKFKEAGIIPACCPEMRIYVSNDLFPIQKNLFQRIDVNAYPVQLPDIHCKRPLIIHSPTAKVAKGTEIIRKVISELKMDYEFDFVELNCVPKDELRDLMKKADIYLDQLIVGGYGMAAMEAMSFGKPVMCYLMDEVYNKGLPEQCPIVNTNPDNLKEKLLHLLLNSQLRHELGKKSRAYVEEFHNAEKVSHQLIELYQEVIDSSANRSRYSLVIEK